jgi:hypothetical protein
MPAEQEALFLTGRNYLLSLSSRKLKQRLTMVLSHLLQSVPLDALKELGSKILSSRKMPPTS